MTANPTNDQVKASIYNAVRAAPTTVDLSAADADAITARILATTMVSELLRRPEAVRVTAIYSEPEPIDLGRGISEYPTPQMVGYRAWIVTHDGAVWATKVPPEPGEPFWTVWGAANAGHLVDAIRAGTDPT